LLISICIPTYNRCSQLTEGLQLLINHIEFNDLTGLVNIYVHDNASTDGTPKVLYALQSEFPEIINYKSNNINLGPDANFLQALSLGNAEYLWLMGDDDLLINGGLDQLVIFIKDLNPDVVWLNHGKFTQKNNVNNIFCDKVKSFSGRKLYLYKDACHFLNEVSNNSQSNLFFMSSHIYKRSLFNACTTNSPVSLYVGTFCVQLYLYLYCITNSENYAIFPEALIFARHSNARDMEVVWGSLFHGIDRVTSSFTFGCSVKKIVFSNLIERHWLQTLGRKARGEWTISQDYPLAFIYFSKFWKFWLLSLPMVLVPSFIAKFFYSKFRQNNLG